jgi:hypothetical protein
VLLLGKGFDLSLWRRCGGSFFCLFFDLSIHLLFVFFIRLQLGDASQPTSWCTQRAGLLIKQQTGTMVSSLYEHGPSKTRGKKKLNGNLIFSSLKFSPEKKILCGTAYNIVSLCSILCAVVYRL